MQQSYRELYKAQTRFAASLSRNIREFYPTDRYNGIAFAIFIKTITSWREFDDLQAIQMSLIWHKTQDAQFGFKVRANGDDTAPMKSVLKGFNHFTRKNTLNTGDEDPQKQEFF